MKLSKHKKGLMWPLIIGFILAIIIGGVLFGIAGVWKKLGNAGTNMTKQFGLAGGDAPNTFLFSPKSINIASDNIKNADCTPDKDSTNTYTCKSDVDIAFETQIYNGGAVGGEIAQRQFYGGIVVCEITCNSRGKSCKLADKTCEDRVIDSIAETCNIKNGETDICDAGSFRFKPKSRYLVYPVATCILDATYGCSAIGMTEAQKARNADAGIIVITQPAVSK